MACDVSPIDVISHLPVLCEEANVGYVYLASREALGLCLRTRRPTTCLFVLEPGKDAEYGDLYQKVKKAVDALPKPS